jgi:NAD+ diphosphatase
MNNIKPGFTGSPLDRLDHVREDPAALAELRSSLRARLLLLDGLDPLPAEDGGLSWGSLADAPADSELALLGLIDGMPRFVALTGAVPGPPRAPALWRMLEHLPAGEAGTYAAARSLVDWHARHRFCARCGSATDPYRAGWARRCGACGAEHFPRTDPVVIMLAEHEGRVLVGRQPGFPQGRYSALAGFVEVGESIEEAVARELKEEAGVQAISVRYVASQPWPFPSSLMIACIAPVEDDRLTIDTSELEDAFWATRYEVSAAMAGDPEARFIAPPPFAIAHTLFRRWLDSPVPSP